MFARVVLCSLVLAGPIAGDAGVCQPVVVSRAVVQHGYVAAAPFYANHQVGHNYGYANQAFGHTFYPHAYDSQALFAYKVRDEEKEALLRSNERAIRSLTEIAETQARLLEAREKLKPADPLPEEESEEPQKAKAPVKTLKDPTKKPTPKEVAAALLKENCASCHSGTKAKGGFILGFPADPIAKIRINTAVQSGEMPSGKPFDAEQKKLVAGWAELTREELREAAAKANGVKTDK